MESIAPERYFCPICNRNILAPYKLNKCPDCGGDLISMEYRIVQENNGGIYEVKVKPYEN